MDKIPANEDDLNAEGWIGYRAKLIGLNGRAKFNGLKVEIVHWDKSNKVFECLIDATKVTVRVRIDNLIMIGEDDDGQLIEAIDDKEAIPLMSTETIRVIGEQRYKQTASGAWRMVNSFGEFFMKNPKRLDYILASMWKEIQRQSKATQKRALALMNKFVTENTDSLPDPTDPAEVERLRVDQEKADELDQTYTLKVAEERREGMLAAEKEGEAKKLMGAAQTPTAQQTPEAIPYGPAAMKMEIPGPPETGETNDTTQQSTLTQEEEDAKHAQ